MDFLAFPKVGKGQEYEGTGPFFEEHWSYCGAMEAYAVQWTPNFKNLAIYSLPLIGTLVKLIDGVFGNLSFTIPCRAIQSELNINKEFEELQDRVAELRVNDFIFLISRAIHMIAFLVLGLFTLEAAMTIFWMELVFTAIIFASRGEVARAILDQLFKMQIKEDERCCKILFAYFLELDGQIVLEDLRSMFGEIKKILLTHESPDNELLGKISPILDRLRSVLTQFERFRSGPEVIKSLKYIINRIEKI